MSRLPSPTAWPGLVRWLTVVLALTGLGLLQPGHCDDSPEAVTTRPAAVQHAGSAAVAAHHHHDHHSRSGHPVVTDTCRLLTTTVAATHTVASWWTAPSTRAVGVAAAPRRPLPPGRIVPRVALDALGVSRT
ncbi:hypothetical protein GCM10020358_61740 [Amorphoplanes nipponensis]|uniref:Uncharacterized protein n=1 Tax=Actinoplanes nipponensis TaxID=135950 RepID=A0A919MR89_9ACTN|nr:hypothetical protein [Actinoplanes nipponensis]GIE53977.1 hypothetical protein Ani05nite_75110 [Actinoplanes nipponensis]